MVHLDLEDSYNYDTKVPLPCCTIDECFNPQLTLEVNTLKNVIPGLVVIMNVFCQVLFVLFKENAKKGSHLNVVNNCGVFLSYDRQEQQSILTGYLGREIGVSDTIYVYVW